MADTVFKTLPADLILSTFISLPETSLENADIPFPKFPRFVGKLSVTPLNASAKPPFFGKLAAMLTIVLPALAAAVTACSSIPVTFLEKLAMALPKLFMFLLKSSKSTSPANHPTTPPLLGNVDAICAIALPAFAAAVTAPSSIFPDTSFENLAIALPNGTIFFAKSSRSFSPVNQLTTPPLLGNVLAISAIALPALAEAVTVSGSIFPATSEENFDIALPNGINF